MKKYISAEKIAENMGVSVSTVWRWLRRGKLPKPFHPTERCTRWDAEEVQAVFDKLQAETSDTKVVGV